MLTQETPHTGGKRRDRVFKVYIELPPGVHEDEIIDYIEDAVADYKNYIPQSRATSFDSNTVAVKRASPHYVR